MKIKFFKKILLLIPLIPVVTYANIEPYLGFVNSLLRDIIPLIIGITVLVFFWNLIKYLQANDEKVKTASRQTMYLGVIILFVMISVLGIINILKGSFNLPTDEPRGTRIDVDSLIVPGN